MPWSGGVYTRSNGQYSGAVVWESDETNGYNIESDRHDNHDQDLAQGINATLNRYGENAMVDDLGMGGNKVVNMAEGTNPADAVTVSQLGSVVPDGVWTNQLLKWSGSAWIPADNVSVADDGTIDTLGEYSVGGTALLAGATRFAVVASMPGTPDAGTIYFVTG